MREVLLTTVILIYLSSFGAIQTLCAQDSVQYHISQQEYEYTIILENVTDADDAKLPSTLLHKFLLVFPEFNTTDHSFHCISRKNRTRAELESILDEYDISVLSWEKENIANDSVEDKE